MNLLFFCRLWLHREISKYVETPHTTQHPIHCRGATVIEQKYLYKKTEFRCKNANITCNFNRVMLVRENEGGTPTTSGCRVWRAVTRGGWGGDALLKIPNLDEVLWSLTSCRIAKKKKILLVLINHWKLTSWFFLCEYPRRRTVRKSHR